MSRPLFEKVVYNRRVTTTIGAFVSLEKNMYNSARRVWPSLSIETQQCMGTGGFSCCKTLRVTRSSHANPSQSRLYRISSHASLLRGNNTEQRLRVFLCFILLLVLLVFERDACAVTTAGSKKWQNLSQSWSWTGNIVMEPRFTRQSKSIIVTTKIRILPQLLIVFVKIWLYCCIRICRRKCLEINTSQHFSHIYIHPVLHDRAMPEPVNLLLSTNKQALPQQSGV